MLRVITEILPNLEDVSASVLPCPFRGVLLTLDLRVFSFRIIEEDATRTMVMRSTFEC